MHLESLVVIILVFINIHAIIVIFIKALEAHKLLVLCICLFLDHDTILYLTVLDIVLACE